MQSRGSNGCKVVNLVWKEAKGKAQHEGQGIREIIKLRQETSSQAGQSLIDPLKGGLNNMAGSTSNLLTCATTHQCIAFHEFVDLYRGLFEREFNAWPFHRGGTAAIDG